MAGALHGLVDHGQELGLVVLDRLGVAGPPVLDSGPPCCPDAPAWIVLPNSSNPPPPSKRLKDDVSLRLGHLDVLRRPFFEHNS